MNTEQGRFADRGNSAGRYDDIISLPHPVSRRHPQMPLSDRAAQFSPFAALTGHGDAVRETARLTEEFADPDEDQKERLDRRLRLLLAAAAQSGGEGPEIEAVYFRPDSRKSGGAYVTVRGRVEKVDGYSRRLIFADGTALPLESVVSLEGGLFEE